MSRKHDANRWEPILDLHTVTTIDTPGCRTELTPWRQGDAWLGGGTWLYSEPQPHLRRVIDLAAMRWPALSATRNGLQVAATCTIAELHEASLRADWGADGWRAAPLVGQCCRALLASFKIWNMATVGGNVCLALPAGSMTSLLSALDGVGTIWMPDGQDRQLPIAELVTGSNQTALAPGEILRQIDVTAEALSRHTAFRQVSLTRHGRSGALLIGTLGPRGFALTITASVPRPVQLRFAGVPRAAELAASIAAAIPAGAYFDDMHGAPDWRQHLTRHLAEEIRCELAP